MDSNKLQIKIKLLHRDASIPVKATSGSVAYDIKAVSMEYDSALDCYVYHTGFALELPKGYGVFIAPRSSNRKTECYMPNSIGIGDSDYRGEYLVCFKSRNEEASIEPPYEVGDRIAQMFILPVPEIEFEEATELSETERGEGGFGSTGK
jgi:dUTP pyrophosphatase